MIPASAGNKARMAADINCAIAVRNTVGEDLHALEAAGEEDMVFRGSNIWLTLAALALGFALILSRVETRHGARNPVKAELSTAGKGWVHAGAASAADVRRILQQDAKDMLQGLNELGVVSLDHAAVQVLVSAWGNARDREPELNWSDIERKDVRFSLANELVRAHVNGFEAVPLEDIAGFGRRYLDVQPDVSRAIYLVVLAGNADDIRRVEEILNTTESVAEFEAGIGAMLSTCKPEAAGAVERIRRREQDEFRKALIAQVLDESAAFRAKLCANTA